MTKCTYNIYFFPGRGCAAVYYADAGRTGFNGTVFADTPEGCITEQRRKMNVFGWAGNIIVRDESKPGHPTMAAA